MGDYRLYNGLIVPRREEDRIVKRRTTQAKIAVKALPMFVKEFRVCVQAGGNWGLWPLMFAELFKTVYSFEPDHECFTALANNCRHKSNVVCLQAALGHCYGLVDLERDSYTTGTQHISGPGIYPTLTIDSLGLPICDLIYLDVEGYEFDALWGSWATLLRCKPIVIFEVTQKRDPGKKTEAYMNKYGYFKLGTIGRDLVMGPDKPEGDFGVKNYEFSDEGKLFEVPAC